MLFNRTKKIRFEIQSLRQELRRERTGQETAAASPAEPTTEEAAEGVPGVEAAKPEQDGEEGEEAKEPEAPAPEEEAITPSAAAGPRAAAETAGAPAAVSAKVTEDLEKKLASRWLIWMGAVAISLAGVFLTAYAIEEGWLGPTTRIVLGFALGLGLTLAGE